MNSSSLNADRFIPIINLDSELLLQIFCYYLLTRSRNCINSSFLNADRSIKVLN